MRAAAARVGLILAFMALLYLAPAMLFEQNDEARSVHLAAPGMVAAGLGIVALAYAMYMITWKELTRR